MGGDLLHPFPPVAMAGPGLLMHGHGVTRPRLACGIRHWPAKQMRAALHARDRGGLRVEIARIAHAVRAHADHADGPWDNANATFSQEVAEQGLGVGDHPATAGRYHPLPGRSGGQSDAMVEHLIEEVLHEDVEHRVARADGESVVDAVVVMHVRYQDGVRPLK